MKYLIFLVIMLGLVGCNKVDNDHQLTIVEYGLGSVVGGEYIIFIKDGVKYRLIGKTEVE